MTQPRTPLEELVAATHDDWSDLGWVYSTCLDQATEPDAVREVALATIGAALRRGLLVAGDVDAAGFHPWPLDAEASYARIREAWYAAPAVIPEPDAIAWFDTTPAGDALAEQVFAREGA